MFHWSGSPDHWLNVKFFASRIMEFQQAYFDDLSFVEYVRTVPLSEAITTDPSDPLYQLFKHGAQEYPLNFSQPVPLERALTEGKDELVVVQDHRTLTVKNYVLAGSAALALLDPNIRPNDFDVFMTYQGDNWMFDELWSDITDVQLIFKSWNAMESNKRFGAMIVSLFDLDCVKVFACPRRTADGLFFDVYQTQKAKRAIETKFNPIDRFNARVQKVWRRAAKYEERGYGYFLPQADVVVSGTNSSYVSQDKVIMDKRDTDYFLIFQHGIPLVNSSSKAHQLGKGYFADSIEALVEDKRFNTIHEHRD